MLKLSIVHFNPIELYPPVLNWLNYLAAGKETRIEVRVFTTFPADPSEIFIPACPNIKIIRAGSLYKKNKFSRYGSYLRFYISATVQLLKWRPDIILYYETLSSLPAIIAKKWPGSRPRLYIHYHEYSSIPEYETGPVLSRWLHQKEKSIYPLAEWLSHTNTERMSHFCQDLEGIRLQGLHILPNYPPAAWQKEAKMERTPARPLRIVYVGALGMDTMFTREFAGWVLQQSGQVIWDIYTGNISEEARTFLGSVDNRLIRLRGAVDYFSLPRILAGYDIGVILYNGHIPNYVYNAPNKLFEYMACGLDTWLPDTLKGSLPYVTTDTWPKVISLDFTKLASFSWEQAIDRDGLNFRPSHYYCEEVLDTLYKEMIKTVPRP